MQPPATLRSCGIVNEGEVAGGLGGVYLPLVHAEVHADVIDVSAIVTVTQHFWQHDAAGLPRSKYVFPLPARAAVCGFEMTAEDGTVIKGAVKEREDARREYEAAVQQGLMTGLVEHVADDIFSISLGALPGQQMLTTKVTYVLDLMEDDVTDQVRLQLPMYIGFRYGAEPAGMAGACRVPENRISISADVRMQGAVKGITSPTHPTLTVLPDGSTQPRIAQYTSADFLQQDFVLVVAADGLDAPRCFAQRAPDGSVAMQLSIVPKFNLPPIPTQEYIFLVDRSGSMKGERIEMAKRALVMLLRALPSQGTSFNIFSFGNACDGLWTWSRPYDADTLEEATAHVDGMVANYGGTKIKEALEKVFRLRQTNVPTAVFLLTDGETYDLQPTLDAVALAVDPITTDALLRVFTLGIGSTTSSAMCESIARVGNGVCLLATTSESIIGKTSKLVRASRTYVLKKVFANWGAQCSILCQGFGARDTTLRQAPQEFPAIYPGHRFVVFTLIDEDFTPPQEVVITAQRDGYGDILQLPVPVQKVDHPPDHACQPLLQTLAARRAIMDIQDRHQADFSDDDKAFIIRLGLQYQLVSKYTSFIAVDQRTRAEIPQPLVPREPTISNETPKRKRGKALARMVHARPRPIRFDELRASTSTTVPTGGLTQLLRVPKPLPSTDLGGQSIAGAKRRAIQVADAQNHGQASSSASAAEVDCGGSAGNAVRTAEQSAEDKAVLLVRLQSFDGSFPANRPFEDVVGVNLGSEATSLGVAEEVWATVLAIAYLKKHMRNQPELLEGLVEKATDFVLQTPDIDFGTLLDRAQSVLS